ncbi:hypothetical protein PVK06_030393 [Gossypium arboreum]|uniref:Uncharacterized protein n=1 Tax=Gossypium arboreum TaxID=29729 RepID=A0ABR0NN72_GOSAR|nr:hypothetical protein PVK06_030393 [Gossypium arboreum]
MCLLATIGRCDAIILVDSSSTHNFVDCQLMKKLHLLVDPSYRLKVMAANKVQLATQGVCRSVLWEAQGYQFSIDFMVCPVKGCDLVLSVQ